MNKRPAIVATIIVLTMAAHQAIAGSCETYKFEKTKGMELVNHVIKTVMRSVVALCWSECAWLPSCFSINVRVQGILFECDLNNSTKTAVGGLVPRVGSDYHEMTEAQGNCKSCINKMKDVLQDGWFRLGSIALKLFQVKKNWSEAEDHCKSIGGNLVSISSSYENDFINDVSAKVHTFNPTSARVHWSLDGSEKEISLEPKSNPSELPRYEEVDGVTALYLTGQYSYANVPATLPFNARGYTMMLWVKPHPVQLSPDEMRKFTIFTDMQTNVNKSFKLFYILQDSHPSSPHFLGFRLYDINGKAFMHATPSNVISPGVWSHVAATTSFEDGQLKLSLVVNGSKFFSRSYSKTPYPLQTRPYYQLGVTLKDVRNKPLNYHGYMKDLMVFDSALSIAEINDAMNYEEPGLWLGLSTMTIQKTFEWSDGSSADHYIPLAVPGTNGSVCVAMGKLGKWMKKKCSEKRSFICQKQLKYVAKNT